MNSPNNDDSSSPVGPKPPPLVHAPNSSTTEDEKSAVHQDKWFDGVCAATKDNIDNVADASTNFARNNPWKMMGICVAVGVALGVMIGLR